MISPDHKSILKILLLILYSTLGSFYLGYMLGVYNLVQGTIEILYDWSTEESYFYSGLINALVPFGAIFGSLISGTMSTKIGKRWTFIIADVLGILGCIILVFKGANIFIGRFVCGIAAGINAAVVPVFIYEMSPKNVSGTFGCIMQAILNVGILLAFLLGLNLPKEMEMRSDPSNHNFWRFMFGFPILTCIVRIIAFVFFYRYDTPGFYILQNRESEAKIVINSFYESSEVELVFENIKKNLSIGANMSYSDLFGKKFASRIWIGISLAAIQQFSGVMAVIFYSDQIFKDNHESEAASRMFSIFIAMILIISAIISGFIVDYFGRKLMLIIGEGFCIIFLLILSILGKYEVGGPTKYIILFYLLSFGLSIGSIFWVYVSEILPEKGVAFVIMTSLFFTGVIGISFPIMKDKIGIAGCFFFYMVCSLIGLIFTIKFVKETKGKNKEEIEDMYYDHYRKKSETDTSLNFY